VLVAAGVAALPAATAGGDSFTPVRLSIRVAPVARLHAPLRIAVSVSADPGALDDRSAPLRVRVKLASECGGTYAYTPGVVLLDRRLQPQPATGHAYTATALGAGRPSSYGMKSVCAWLEEEGDDRVFASDQSLQVNVSPACTRTARRYDVARHRRRHRLGRRTLARLRRAARRACGPGVTL
jgi:hypothetical protein